MTVRYLEGLSAAAASALAVWVGFVMWLSWRFSARIVVIESSKLYPPLFWTIGPGSSRAGLGKLRGGSLVQIIGCSLGMSGCRKDAAAVIFENF
jgi:hypothetical protein